MPVMDGYEATHEIRNSEKEDAKSIPIIAMTANAFDDDMKKSKTAGMGAHLSKPLDIQKMIEMIGNLCDKKCKPILIINQIRVFKEVFIVKGKKP